MLDSASLLQVTLLKESALLAVEVQPGITQSCINFLADAGTVYSFALAHDFALFRPHLHPTLGISLKNLSILWWHGQPTLTRIIHRWSALRWRQGVAGNSLLAVRLGVCRGRRPN